MNLDRYLDRIGIARPQPTVEGLDALQTAQMRAITFENLDPLLGLVPDVTPDGIFAKLVDQGRGGYCFELNTLFGDALTELGFAAERVMARVRNGAPQGAQRSHLAWVVTIGGEEWLADTGFGGSGTSQPLRLAERGVQTAPTGRYRLTNDAAAGETVLERETPEGWFQLYGFDRVDVRDPDIAAANFVCARWERAPFASNLMLSRHSDGGRVSLLNTALRVETRDGVEKSEISSRDELQARLGGDFALPVDDAFAAAIWDRLETLGHVGKPAA